MPDGPHLPVLGGTVDKQMWGTRIASRIGLSSVGDRSRPEIADRRFHQPFEIPIGQLDEFKMRAGVESHLPAIGKRFVRIDTQAVQVSEWRHGPGFAIREASFELVLARQGYVLDRKSTR